MKKKMLFLLICLVMLLVPITISKTGLVKNIAFADSTGEVQAVTNQNDFGNGQANCAGIAGIVYYGVYVVKVIQIVAPIVLIIWGSIDLIKSIISGDDKKIAAARKPFIQRLISAVIIFLLPWIANFVIGFASSSANSEWQECWRKAWSHGEKSDISGENLNLWGEN